MKNIMTNKFWWVARSFATLVIFGSVAMSQGMLISEVAEGSSNNKYIEIYNGTGADVDLSNYALSSCSNGCDDSLAFDYPNNVTLIQGLHWSWRCLRGGLPGGYSSGELHASVSSEWR